MEKGEIHQAFKAHRTKGLGGPSQLDQIQRKL